MYLLGDPSERGQYRMIGCVLLCIHVAVLCRVVSLCTIMYNRTPSCKIPLRVHIFALENNVLFCVSSVYLCVCVVLTSLSSWSIPGDRSHSGHSPYSRPSLIIYSNWSESQSHEKAN